MTDNSHEGLVVAGNEVARATVTELLRDWGDRDGETESRLFDEVYPGLLKIAGNLLQHERQHHTLDSPALVHEAFLRLVPQSQNRWRNRGHFYAVAAMAMRRVLRDCGRRKGAIKRSVATQTVPLKEELLTDGLPDIQIEALKDVLEVLLNDDAHLAAVVELRFFGGLTLDEVATVLKRSRTAIVADWRRARLWLAEQLTRRG